MQNKKKGANARMFFCKKVPTRELKPIKRCHLVNIFNNLEESWDIFCYMIGECDFMMMSFFRMGNDN